MVSSLSTIHVLMWMSVRNLCAIRMPNVPTHRVALLVNASRDISETVSACVLKDNVAMISVHRIRRASHLSELNANANKALCLTFQTTVSTLTNVHQVITVMNTPCVKTSSEITAVTVERVFLVTAKTAFAKRALFK